jgi:hypothetical protein
MANAFLAILIVSVTLPSVCLGGAAAPDTAKAADAISAALAEAGNDPKNAAKGSQADGCGRYIEGLRVIYGGAGYDFDATVRKLPEYLKLAGNENVGEKEMTAWVLTSILVAGLPNECKGGSGEYGKHFDRDTAEALKAIFDRLK